MLLPRSRSKGPRAVRSEGTDAAGGCACEPQYVRPRTRVVTELPIASGGYG